VRWGNCGDLRLDTPVWPLIDDVIPRPAGADARLAAVTVRDLLRHSAGFLTWMDPFFNDTREVVDAFGPAAATSCAEGAAWFLTWPLSYTPGEDQGYTNMDYCLLGAVLEATTGRPWWQVVAAEVLQPAAMPNERIGRTRGDRLAHEAVHVTPPPDVLGGGWFMESLGAAGAWLGTAVDVVRFVDALATGPLVSPATRTAMLADPGIDPAATAWWGLGLRNYGGGTWGHTGSLRQARAMFLHRPDGTSWAILVNGTFPDHGDELRALMDRAMAAVPVWPTADLHPDLP
jgi:D-alanyl-D-alanine carboxypeptidase